MTRAAASARDGVAFVLGGGGILGAAEVGMLAALLEAGIQPDVVVGTSIGAINGAAIAADPTPEGAQRLSELWQEVSDSGVFSGSLLRRVSTLARTRTALHSNAELRRLLERGLGGVLIEDLAVRFQCVAASIERAEEHWFTEGPVVDAVLASSAVPGILPPVRIGREHYIDGGIVNSIPVSRAVQLSAATIYVCHVGRIDGLLRAPRQPLEVGLVAFEVARRHRFHADMAALPDGVTVHVLPTGDPRQPAFDSLANFRYRDASRVADRIARARRATLRYLHTHGR